MKNRGIKRRGSSESTVSKKAKYQEGNGTDVWEVRYQIFDRIFTSTVLFPISHQQHFFILFQVSKIIDDVELKDGTRQYLVRWKGFSSKENTWEPEAHLDCPDLIKKYLDTQEKVCQSLSVGTSFFICDFPNLMSVNILCSGRKSKCLLTERLELKGNKCISTILSLANAKVIDLLRGMY